MCDAARLGPNNEVRIGGNRVGVVESLETVDAPPGSGCQTVNGDSSSTIAKLNLKLDESAKPIPENSTIRSATAPPSASSTSRSPAGTATAAARGGDAAGRPVPGAGRVRRHLQHLRHRHAREQPAGAAGLRRRVRGPRRLAERGDRRPQPAVREPPAGFGGARGPDHPARALLPRARRRRSDRCPVAVDNAEQFTNGAIAFGAISSDPDALRDTISGGPPVLEAGLRSFPAAAVPGRLRRVLPPAPPRGP